MKTQELCELAAQEIEAHGWCQGAYSTSDNAHCVIGAVWAVSHELGLGARVWWDALHELARRAGSKRAEEGGEPLFMWNDKPGRTVEEVLALLRDKLPVPVKEV